MSILKYMQNKNNPAGATGKAGEDSQAYLENGVENGKQSDAQVEFWSYTRLTLVFPGRKVVLKIIGFKVFRYSLEQLLKIGRMFFSTFPSVLPCPSAPCSGVDVGRDSIERNHVSSSDFITVKAKIIPLHAIRKEKSTISA